MSIITISRGTFTGGQLLARCVAERLGYRCIGREEVIEAATWYGVSAQRLTEAMDKPPSFWERLMGERTAYLDCIRATLCERAREGNLVYHGHVGHLMLPGISHVVRVRVIADMEYRVKVAMDARNLEHTEAVAYIEKVDKERVEWSRFLHGVNWDDACLYDVTLNLSRMSVAGACEAVAQIAALQEFQPTAQSLKAMEDLALGSRVSAELVRDRRTTMSGLKVTATDGVVTIEGTVRSDAIADAIPVVVRSVQGVREVRCDVMAVPLLYDNR